MTIVKEMMEFLSQNKFGSLATCMDNQPDNRPMECAFVSDKGLFFYTKKGEDLAEQISNNQNVCFTATDSNYNYIKVRGSVVFSNDEEDQVSILNHSNFAKQVFQESDRSSMIVFYLAHGKGMMHAHGNNKPVSFEF